MQQKKSYILRFYIQRVTTLFKLLVEADTWQQFSAENSQKRENISGLRFSALLMPEVSEKLLPRPV